MFRLVEPEPSDARVMFAGSREIRGPDGEIVASNLIVPDGPALSVTIMASDCTVPGWTLSVDWSVFSLKSGWAGEWMVRLWEVLFEWLAESMTVRVTMYDPAVA